MEPNISGPPAPPDLDTGAPGETVLDPYGNLAWLASKRPRIETNAPSASNDYLKNPNMISDHPHYQQFNIGHDQDPGHFRSGPATYYGMENRWSKVVKPESDEREYGVFTLPNKMKVIIISEPSVDKASVALSVQAGSMLDPQELFGMAHLCQRMIMVANDKVSEKNAFEKFVEEGENGGEFSAFTQRDLTTFLFDVSPSVLPEALERFAEYFISPTFPDSAIEQEVNNIQEEHENRMQSDEERRAQVALSLTKPHHPFGQFDCGNRDTLWRKPKEKGIDIRDEVVRFYRRYYSANLMNLAMLGREPLDVLYEYAVTVFQGVPNAKKMAPRWMESPYGPDQLMTRIEMVPLADSRRLLLIFPIPDYTSHYKTGTIPYLRRLLSFEGPGSLLSLLKKIQWVTMLEVDYEQPGCGFAFFTLDFHLTHLGLDNLDNIVSHFFKYMKMLRKEGPARRIWDELRTINETKFRYLAKEANFVENLVTLMSLVPKEEILSCRYLLTEYKPTLIRELVNFLMPRNLRIIVSSKENEKIVNETEFWHGVKYRYSAIDEKLLQEWSNCGFLEEFRLPPPNPFIATNFDLKPRDEKAQGNRPRIITDTDLSRVWFLQDNEFLVPKATIILAVTSPLPKQEPINYNMTRIMSKVIDNSLTEFTCSANAAGLTFNVETTIEGLTLTIHGYDDKLPALFNYILNRIFHFCSYGNVGPHYDQIVQEYIRELWNRNEQEPYIHATELVDHLLCNHSWSSERLLAAMSDEIPPSRLVNFAQRFFSHVQLEWFFHGNYTETEARAIYEEGLKYFQWVKAKPLSASQILETREVILATGSTNAFHTEHQKHVNSATAIVLQIGGSNSTSNSNIRDTVMMDLIENILYEPAADILTSTHKLVWTDVRKSRGTLALQIVVQGPKEPSFLEGCIEHFLSTMAKTIKKMPQDAFLEHCISLAVRKMEKPKTFWDRGVKIFHEIFTQTFNFDSQAVELMELQKITHKELTDFYNEWISPKGPSRRKLCVKVSSGEERPTTRSHLDCDCLLLSERSSTTLDLDNRHRHNNIELNSGTMSKLPSTRENVYTAKSEVTRTKSVIQKWTPTLDNSIREDSPSPHYPNSICHSSSSSASSTGTKHQENEEDAQLISSSLPNNTSSTHCSEHLSIARRSTKKLVESTLSSKHTLDKSRNSNKNLQEKSPKIKVSAKEFPQNHAESDADTDTDTGTSYDSSDEEEEEAEDTQDFESYYLEIEEEIKVLSNLKNYLLKQIKNQSQHQKSNPDLDASSKNHHRQSHHHSHSHREQHGDELEQPELEHKAFKIGSKPSMNIDIDLLERVQTPQEIRIERCKKHFEQLILQNKMMENGRSQLNINQRPLEYSVYTLNSITHDQQQGQKDKQPSSGSALGKPVDFSSEISNGERSSTPSVKKEKKSKRKQSSSNSQSIEKENLSPPFRNNVESFSPRFSTQYQNQGKTRDLSNHEKDKDKEKDLNYRAPSKAEKLASDIKISKRKSIGKSESSNQDHAPPKLMMMVETKKSEGKILRGKMNAISSTLAERFSSREHGIHLKDKSVKKIKSKHISSTNHPSIATSAEIQELDFDIKNEIKHLKNLRKMLDAKAKKILVHNNDSGTSGTSDNEEHENFNSTSKSNSNSNSNSNSRKRKSSKKSRHHPHNNNNNDADEKDKEKDKEVTADDKENRSKKRSKGNSWMTDDENFSDPENTAKRPELEEGPSKEVDQEEQESDLRRIVSIAKSKSKMGRLKKRSEAQKMSLNKCLEDFKAKFGAQTLSDVLALSNVSVLKSGQTADVEKDGDTAAEVTATTGGASTSDDEHSVSGGSISEDCSEKRKSSCKVTTDGHEDPNPALKNDQGAVEGNVIAAAVVNNNTNQKLFSVVNKDSTDGSFRDEDLIDWLRDVVKSETRENLKVLSSKTKKKVSNNNNKVKDKEKNKDGSGQAKKSLVKDRADVLDPPEEVRYSVPGEKGREDGSRSSTWRTMNRIVAEMNNESDGEPETVVQKKSRRKVNKVKEENPGQNQAKSNPNDSNNNNTNKTGKKTNDPWERSKAGRKKPMSDDRGDKDKDKEVNAPDSGKKTPRNPFGLPSRVTNNNNSNNNNKSFKSGAKSNNNTNNGNVNNNSTSNGTYNGGPRVPSKFNILPKGNSANGRGHGQGQGQVTGKAPFKTFGQNLSTLSSTGRLVAKKKSGHQNKGKGHRGEPGAISSGASRASFSSNDYENHRPDLHHGGGHANALDENYSDHTAASDSDVGFLADDLRAVLDDEGGQTPENYRRAKGHPNPNPEISGQEKHESRPSPYAHDKQDHEQKHGQGHIPEVTPKNPDYPDKGFPESEDKTENGSDRGGENQDGNDDQPPPVFKKRASDRQGSDLEGHEGHGSHQCNPNYNFYDCANRRKSKSKSPPIILDNPKFFEEPKSPPLPPRPNHGHPGNQSGVERAEKPKIGNNSGKASSGRSSSVSSSASRSPSPGPGHERSGSQGRGKSSRRKKSEKNMEFILPANDKPWDASHVTIEQQEENFRFTDHDKDKEKDDRFDFVAMSKKMAAQNPIETTINNSNVNGSPNKDPPCNVHVIKDVEEWKKGANYFPSPKPFDPSTNL